MSQVNNFYGSPAVGANYRKKEIWLSHYNSKGINYDDIFAPLCIFIE